MANDPNTIQYVIQEDGFWYVASKEKNPYVPELTVSAKGIANGLSTEYNDGWDFGPDSYDPNSTASIPYTQTSGIQEAVNYGGSDTDVLIEIYGEIKLSVPVILPAKNITIRGSLYNINTNGSNPTRGASAIVADTDFQPITYNGVSVNYLLYTQTEITGGTQQLNIYGILFSGYPISIGSESTTNANPDVNGIAINGGTPHLYIDYCKINLLNNGIVINSSGGPKYIGHTHWTYIADGGIGLTLNSGVECVLDSPEFFTYGKANTPSSYILVQTNNINFNVNPLRISNANFANTLLCKNGAIAYGYASSIQISNSVCDGGYFLYPAYINTSNAGIVELDNVIFGNNYNASNEEALIYFDASASGLQTVITAHNLTYINQSPSTGATFYLIEQGSSAVYQADIALYMDGFYPVHNGTGEIANYIQIANVSGYDANLHLTGITNFTSSTAGTTAGTVNQTLLDYRSSYKKIILAFNGYENDTTTNQTIDFLLAFSSYAVITGNNTGLTISATTSGITITAPDSTTTYSGIVIIEGY